VLAVPHGTPLWPVAPQLRLAAGLEPADSAAAGLDKLEALLRQGADDIGEATPAVAALLGIDMDARHLSRTSPPQQLRARALASLIGQLLGLARRRPVLMVIEDAHWADPTTLELVGLALDQVAGADAADEPARQPAGARRSPARDAAHAQPPRPGRGDRRRLASDLGLPPGTMDEIAARTDGGAAVLRGADEAVLEARPRGATIPVSLHASLMARLDRVPGSGRWRRRRPASDASSPTRCSPRSRPCGSRATRALDRLAAAELVFARGVPPEASYTFKHALVGDAAHEGLLRGRRKEVHRATGRSRRPCAAGARPRPRSSPTITGRRAIPTAPWTTCSSRGGGPRSAPRMPRRSAHLRAGLGLLQGLPDGEANRRRELELLLALSGPLIATRGYAAPETAAVFGRARRLCEALGDRRRLFPGAVRRVAALPHGPRQEGAAGRRAYLELASGDGGTIPMLTGHRLMSLALCCRGLSAEALGEAEAGLALYDPAAHAGWAWSSGRALRAAHGIGVAWSAWFLGAPGRSREASAAALRRAQELGHLNTLAYALHMAAVCLENGA
jgi:hypothetical protein